MNKLSITRVAAALAVFGGITYMVCYIWHPLAHSAFTDSAFAAAFPGFSSSATGFVIGLSWSIVYSMYIAHATRIIIGLDQIWHQPRATGSTWSSDHRQAPPGEMFDLRDGLMTGVGHAFDTAGLMRQLGVLRGASHGCAVAATNASVTTTLTVC